MTYDGLLTGTCTIKQPTKTQGPTGEMTVTWSDKAMGVKCRRVALKNPLVLDTIGHVTVANFRFYFPAGQDVGISDRIEYESELYEVVLASQDSSGHHVEVAANKVSFA